jgi:hypothetical protein
MTAVKPWKSSGTEAPAIRSLCASSISVRPLKRPASGLGLNLNMMQIIIIIMTLNFHHDLLMSTGN